MNIMNIMKLLHKELIELRNLILTIDDLKTTR
jgi:hypothetical protein